MLPPPPVELSTSAPGQPLFCKGFPDPRCNGLYREQVGSRVHFVNGAGVHAFFSTGIREWCLKDEYDPNCKSAKAIAAWGRLPQPQPCASEWRVWNSGWDSAMVAINHLLRSRATEPLDSKILGDVVIIAACRVTRIRVNVCPVPSTGNPSTAERRPVSSVVIGLPQFRVLFSSPIGTERSARLIRDFDIGATKDNRTTERTHNS